MANAMSNSCVIDANGIYAPDYPTILNNLNEGYKTIFGLDSYIEADSMDGQLMAIYALAQHENNNAIINCYNSYSPTYAQGVGLSSLVKINGIKRLVATKSTCNVVVTGVIGTIINNGRVGDGTNTWLLPDVVTIPSSGDITVLATAENEGAIDAPIGTINKILNPTYGWQSVNNLVSATQGSPVENDYTLRTRQTVSTAYPASTVVEAVEAGVANVVGILKYKVYENDTNITDANGIPPKNISVVTVGGSPFDIAYAIAKRKSAGCGTYGTSNYTVYLSFSPLVVKYSVGTPKTIGVVVNITAGQGYTSLIGLNLKQKLVDYINGLRIGDDVYYTNLIQQAVGQEYVVNSLTSSLNGGAFNTTDKTILFNEYATANLSDITLNVV